MTLGQHRSALFAVALSDRIAEQQLRLKDVAARTGISYEHIRKLVSGNTLPSPEALQRICKALGLPRDEMSRKVLADTALRTWGIHIMSPQSNTDLRHIENFWFLLTTDQRQTVLAMIKDMARRNQQLNKKRLNS